MRTYALIAILFVSGALPAVAADNPACAKFEEPLAYNACLARQGPPARMVRGVAAPRASATGIRRFRAGPDVAHTRGGRAHAVFDVR